MAGARTTPTGGFDQYRGIYLKRIPTYSYLLMIEVLESYGVTPERLLKNTGFDIAELSREGSLVSYLQTLKFIRNIISHSPRPDIGLVIGDKYQISTFGILGYAMMSCPTWADAMYLGNTFSSVSSSLVQIEIDRKRSTEDYLSIEAMPYYADFGDIEPFTIEKLFSSLIALSRPLLATPAYPARVTFAYPAPAWADKYEDVFRCPVSFNAGSNRIEWDMSVLRQPLLQANVVSERMGRKLCEEFMGNFDQGVDSIIRKVSDLLLGSPGVMPSMEQVADKLNMSSRTLRRSLNAENTSFQTIADAVRHDMACRYLQNSQLSLDDIAHLVGFTETTNFRRAFKRWQGTPPASYRREHQFSR